MRNILIGVIVIVLIAGGVFYYVNKQGGLFGILTAKQAGEKVINYINTNLLPSDSKASLTSATAENGVYKIRLKVGDNEFNSYVTKNGNILFVEGIDLSKKVNTDNANQTNQQTNSNVTPQAKPDVKLFVMSYCPYGLQTEKMFLPVYNLLKNKADMSINFVDYAMHGKKELDENLRQYCIQKEQKDKYYAYLSCFTKADASAACLTEAKVDQAKMSTCVANTDKQYSITTGYNNKSTWVNGEYPKFAVETDLNDQYKVSGSPTIVINGKQVNVSPRSPEKFKQAVCDAFETKPAECSQTLSDAAASPGFGTSTTSTTTGGGCATQ